MGPPQHIVGATVATDAVLARGDDVVLSLGRVLAFPDGFLVELRAVGRVEGIPPMSASEWRDYRVEPEQILEVEVPGHVVQRLGASGSTGRFDTNFWVSPLPADGPVEVTCSWPEHGIEGARAERAGAAIRAAARKAVQVADPPAPPEPPPPPSVPPRQPAGPPWWAPGDLMRIMPGVAALELVLGRGDAALVTASHALVYENGWQLEVRWAGPGKPPWPPGAAWRPGMPGEMPDDYVRFGLEFADGRQADNLTQLPYPDDSGGLVLLRTSGGGFAARGAQTYWIAPLPPPGALTLWCGWPANGIDETRTEIDAAVILEAAGRATA